MKFLMCILFKVLMLSFIHAQTSSEIYLGIKKLNVLGSVLYVAAHPDDENTRLLAFFSKERLYRTAYLSITRGDGGQNLIGDEQGIELGLIRTQELLSARRIDGGEQYFTRAYDFGYSKTPEETFTKWGRDKVLADVVWVIRQSQPDVIITRFPTTGEGGHGHHTASAILANEAFSAAADASRFPEQLKWVKPWQAKRILWNSFNFGGNNTQRDDQFKFDVGSYNPVLGKSYGELASESRSQHKSQGFGVPAGRGEAIEFFKSTSDNQPVNDLFEDIITDWSRVPGGDKISGLIGHAIENFDFTQPHKSVPPLVDIHKSLKALSAGYWRDKKLKETEQLIESAAGLFLEAYTTEAYIAQTDSLRVLFSLNNRTRNNISLNNIQIDGQDTVFSQPLVHNKNLIFNKTIYVPAHKPITQPYWLEEKMEEGYFNIRDQRKIGQPDVDAAFNVVFNLTIEGQPFSIIKPVKYKFTHPVRGEVYQPVVVVPQVYVNTNPSLVIFKKDNEFNPTVSVITKAAKNLGNQKAQIDLRLKSHHWGVRDSGFTLRKGASKEYDFTVKRTYSQNMDNAVPFVQLNNDTMINYLALQTIYYEHIPNINYFYTDAVKILNIDLKTRGKKIGYIPGAGDRVQQALEIMGFEVSILNNNELSRSNLKQFDAIISGVRAYNTNEWLTAHYDKLMKYVEGGGNLIVQYNTSNQIGPVRAKISPYNFTISRNRITDENAAVDFLIPNHPVLNFPNKIGNEDFKGWIQERSIYHATGWDKNFESILAMNDPDEKKDSGSLVIAKYGKGFFTYTGLVFFRELPAGVPGAYRLLANLVALNQKKEM